MNHPQRKARIAGRIIIFIVIYAMLGAAVYVASQLLLQNGMAVDVPWIASAQKKLYRAGISINRNNWLGQRECITDDPDLVYKPSIGECKFENVEFSTTLNFTDEGRYTGTRPPGTGIAVIGDSHAMGWGVDDHETFSSVLQELSSRPVYNLAVGSYATSREFIRLGKSGVLDKVDTIIVQYCNNDYHENILYDSSSRQKLHEKVFSQFEPVETTQMDRIGFIVRGYWLTLKAPFSSLAEKLRRKNFMRHYGPFIDIVRKNSALIEGKRVIVFYSNPFGQKYRNYPEGVDTGIPNVTFVDLDLAWNDHFKLDGHLAPAGHRNVALRLFEFLQDKQPPSD